MLNFFLTLINTNSKPKHTCAQAPVYWNYSPYFLREEE